MPAGAPARRAGRTAGPAIQRCSGSRGPLNANMTDAVQETAIAPAV